VAEFPAAPLAPGEFLEDWLPRAFAEADVPDTVKSVDLELGVLLAGEGGGEWVFQMQSGTLTVRPGSRADAALTLVQTVADWRGALWEGRGGAVGRQATSVFRPTELRPGELGAGGISAAPGPAALAQMQSLGGLIRMVVADAAAGDWAIAFKLGPGEIPAEPTTVVTLSAEDVSAMEQGDFNPLEAFMAGRIQVDGDIALLMQMQAIQMQT